MKKPFYLFLILLLTIAGCDQASTPSNDKRVAAVVNGVEITERQVDYLYNRSARPGMSPTDSIRLRLRTLGELVRMELFSGKAKELKLDQSPDFAISQYIAQKSLLASLAERKLVKPPTVTPQQIDAIVQNNPLLFSKRKLFIFDEVVFQNSDKKLLESIDAMAMNGASMTQILNELTSRKIPFRGAVQTMPSEKIPAQLLKIMDTLKPGFPQTIDMGGKISLIIRVHEAIPQPIQGEQARNYATGLFMRSYGNATMVKVTKDLIDNSKITYADSYTKIMKDKSGRMLLPVANQERIAHNNQKKMLLGGVVSATILVAFMALTALMRGVSDNKYWIPGITKKQSITDNQESGKAYYIPYKAPDIHRFYFILIVLALLASTAYQIVSLWSFLTVWIAILSIVIGLVAGFLVARIYVIFNKASWSRVKYLVISGIFTIPVIMAAYAIKMYMNL
jgi:EpsD family peptidyl-prolyl cis-trans isomerase